MPLMGLLTYPAFDLIDRKAVAGDPRARELASYFVGHVGRRPRGRRPMMLGLGVSGPQIVEGWYGRPWGKPNLRLRDYVAILKKVFRREYVAHEGHETRLPYKGEGSSGLGKPLKTILHPQGIPVLLGTDTPLNVRMTAEVADGWLAMHVTPSTMAQARSMVGEGIAKRTDGMTMEKFEIHGTVGVKVNDDVKAALQEPEAQIALYAGGMGAKTKNFHKEAMIKRGYAEAAERIQELFLAGRKDEATAAVPDDYVDEEWLVGPPARIQERFKPWRDSGLSTLKIRTASPEVLEIIAAVAD
jgi:F420-dependent oxidoreductase-like protein